MLLPLLLLLVLLLLLLFLIGQLAKVAIKLLDIGSKTLADNVRCVPLTCHKSIERDKSTTARCGHRGGGHVGTRSVYLSECFSMQRSARQLCVMMSLSDLSDRTTPPPPSCRHHLSGRKTKKGHGTKVAAASTVQ